MKDFKWNQREKSISRAAFDKAYNKECAHIIEAVKKQASTLTEPEDIWTLEDYLFKKRKDIDQRYDYRYSVLIPVFGVLVRQGWIEMKDLEGLGQEKLSKIQSIANFLND